MKSDAPIPPEPPSPRAPEPPSPRGPFSPDLAVELARLARERAVRQRLQELFLAFSRAVSVTLRLGVALETLAQDANALFGTARTSVWLHRRRARELALAASSDAEYLARTEPVSTEDSTAAATRGMRLEEFLVTEEGGQPIVIAPLRGWRRALGTIVVEGRSTTLDDAAFHDLVYEFSRQLSIGVENVQLLEDVMRQRRLLEDTFNSLVDLVLVTDNAFGVVQMNEAFVERTGGERGELLERSLPDLVGDEMAAWMARHEPGIGARSRQFKGDKLGGTLFATVTPLLTQEGEPVGHVLVVRDISAQVQLEIEREALQGRLAQSEKLASLGQFVAGIAHEMNNPLQGVLGHLELLMKTSPAAKPLRAELRRIYQDGDRAAKIVRNLLVFAGSQRMTRRRVSIDRVLSRAISSRAAALQRGKIGLARVQGTALPNVSGDPLLLQQAFLNILINAEHAVEGGHDGIRLIRVTTSLNHARRMVVATIRDNGPGIPAEVLPRIFDPFFTTKDVGKGTGLGLAITYGIIQEHGGTIRAENEPDAGAVFTIELPAAE
jgi:PAS domain S-box-containing protein